MNKAYIAAAIALLIGAAIVWHIVDKKLAVKDAIKETEIAMNRDYSDQLQKAKDKAKLTEKALQEEKDKALKEKNERLKDINAKLDSALSSLQFYKNCATAPRDSSNSQIRTACPGAELSREDAEFLIREAAKADEVVEERNYYYERYESARSGLESHTKPTAR